LQDIFLKMQEPVRREKNISTLRAELKKMIREECVHRPCIIHSFWRKRHGMDI
jgi:hypothetical protein